MTETTSDDRRAAPGAGLAQPRARPAPRRGQAARPGSPSTRRAVRQAAGRTTTPANKASRSGSSVTRRSYPPEVRRIALAEVSRAIEDADGERFGVVARVARELEIAPETLRNWVRRADGLAVAEPGATVAAPEAEDRPVPVESVSVSATAAGRLKAVLSKLRWVLLAYGVSRLVVLVTVAVAVSQPYRGLTTGRVLVPWPPVPASSPTLGAFGVWDAAWYVHIASFGYSQPTLAGSHLSWDMAFFPLFPDMVRALAAATGLSALAAGVALALALGALATVAVWLVARRLLGERSATVATTLWALFPGALVLSFAYSEGLTVLAGALCLLALLSRRWIPAGLAAAVAGATQPAGLVLVLCCGYAALKQVTEVDRAAPGPPTPGLPAALSGWPYQRWPYGQLRPMLKQSSPLAAPLLAPLGALAYFAYLWRRSGDPLAWYHAEKLFWDHGGALWGLYKTTLAPVLYVLGHPLVLDDAVMLSAGIAIAAAGVVWLWRWRPPTVLWIWVVGTLGLTLISAPVGLRPRFLMVAFPIFLAAARRLPRRWLGPALAAEAVLLALLTYFTVTTFTLVP